MTPIPIPIPLEHLNSYNRLKPFNVVDECNNLIVDVERRQLYADAFPYTVIVDSAVFNAASAGGWCKENLEYPHAVLLGGGGFKIMFQTENDATHFRLRF